MSDTIYIIFVERDEGKTVYRENFTILKDFDEAYDYARHLTMRKHDLTVIPKENVIDLGLVWFGSSGHSYETCKIHMLPQEILESIYNKTHEYDEMSILHTNPYMVGKSMDRLFIELKKLKLI